MTDSPTSTCLSLLWLSMFVTCTCTRLRAFCQTTPKSNLQTIMPSYNLIKSYLTDTRIHDIIKFVITVVIIIALIFIHPHISTNVLEPKRHCSWFHKRLGLILSWWVTINWIHVHYVHLLLNLSKKHYSASTDVILYCSGWVTVKLSLGFHYPL